MNLLYFPSPDLDSISFKSSIPSRSRLASLGVSRYSHTLFINKACSQLYRIASSLSPEDPEIAFNHAAVLEASECNTRSCYVLTFIQLTFIAGRLDEALEKYKLSQQFGVERAAVHIRNVRSLR
jgi:hypothetical protein